MRGYTLVEAIAVIVVIGIVGAIGAWLVMETADAFSFASRFQDNAVSCAIVAMNRMSKEMRQLKNDASVTGANAGQFSFTDVNDNAISFNRSGNTLMRNSDGLSDNVTALTFTYYDDDGNTIATPALSPNNTDIRRINADFSISAGSNTLNFRFQLRPQNLRRFNEKFK